MSMYSQLLELALEARAHSGSRDPAASPLAELLRCRSGLAAAAPPWSDPLTATTALADQVAYDIALIEWARSIGIQIETSDFDRPEEQRLELERKLEARDNWLLEAESSARPGPGSDLTLK